MQKKKYFYYLWWLQPNEESNQWKHETWLFSFCYIFPLCQADWLMNCCPPDLWSLQHGAPIMAWSWHLTPGDSKPLEHREISRRVRGLRPGAGRAQYQDHHPDILLSREERERSKGEFIIPFQFHHRRVGSCLYSLSPPSANCHPVVTPWSRGPGYIYPALTQSGDKEVTALLAPARNDSVLYFSCFSNLILFCCDKSCLQSISVSP